MWAADAGAGAGAGAVVGAGAGAVAGASMVAAAAGAGAIWEGEVVAGVITALTSRLARTPRIAGEFQFSSFVSCS